MAASRRLFDEVGPGGNAHIPEPENATDEPMGDDSDCAEYEADCSDDDSHEGSDSIDDDIEEFLRMNKSAASEEGAETKSLHLAAASARQRLTEVAQGKMRLDVGDLISLLTGNLLANEAAAVRLDIFGADMLTFLFENPDRPKIDPEVGLRMAQQFSRLRESNARDARKTADLLARLATPQRPLVKLIAVGAGQCDMERNG